MRTKLLLLASACLAFAAVATAQGSPPQTPPAPPSSTDTADSSEASATGTWEGAIETPGSPLGVVVTLAEEAGSLSGTIDIPAQGAVGLPLTAVSVAGQAVTFAIATTCTAFAPLLFVPGVMGKFFRVIPIIVILVLGVMGGLAIFNQRYVEPYGALEGQLVLLVVAALFGAGLLWMRRLSQPQQISRFLVVDRTARARDLERLLGQVEDGVRAGEAARATRRSAGGGGRR